QAQGSRAGNAERNHSAGGVGNRVEASQRAAVDRPLVRGIHHDSWRVVRADHGRADANAEPPAGGSAARAEKHVRKGGITMTGLLVSVRSAVEAQLAFGGGADVVDVKEPSRGSLGAADPSTWKEILDQLGGCVVTSAALGELTDDAVAGLAVQTAGFRFAKVGLSNWNTDSHRRWRAVCDAIPSAVKLVPVVYADATAAGWPSVLEMMGFAFSLARDANSRLILIDTFLKQGQTLLDLVSVAQLHCIIRD